jgi:hypothetical protein
LGGSSASENIQYLSKEPNLHWLSVLFRLFCVRFGTRSKRILFFTSYFLASSLQCSLSILYVFFVALLFALFLHFWQLHVTHKALVILAYLEKGISKYDVSISPSF